MSGFDFVESIRLRGFQGLVLGLTGASSHEVHEKFLSAGVNQVLMKPVDANTLRGIITNHKKLH